MQAVIDLVQAEQSKQLNIARDHVREEIEKEHLESLSELEKCLQQKHVEQLEKLAEFQRQHVQEVAELKYENDKKVQEIMVSLFSLNYDCCCLLFCWQQL